MTIGRAPRNASLRIDGNTVGDHLLRPSGDGLVLDVPGGPAHDVVLAAAS